MPRTVLLRGVWLTAFLLAAFALSGPALAQTTNGSIIGRVLDASGAAIPGAAVTVTNTGTQVARQTQTGADGGYGVPNLAIGNYSVAVTHAGFAKTVTQPQALGINQALRIDVHLNVGAVSQEVSVSAIAAQVETKTPTVGATVTGATIQNLPLNGRNTLTLALTEPGVATTPGSTTSFTIAGGRPDSIEYLLDGGNNNSVTSNAVVFNPNPDTVAEFRVLTNNYTAEYGKNGGGVVSVVLKSGNNQFHGSAFEYARNTGLDANLFFNNANDAPRPILRRHQFGGTFGGPLLHDKLFFFGGYQGQRQTQTQTGQLIGVYTPAELTGDFSQANNGAPDPNVVCFLTGYNPGATAGQLGTPCGPTVTDKNGNKVVLPGTTHPYYQSAPALAAQGIIDPTKIDPVAQAYIKAGLIPSTAGGTLQPTANVTDNVNQYLGRVDYYLSSKDTISATLGLNQEPLLNPMSFSGGQPDVPGYAYTNHTTDKFLNLSWTRIFSATLVNEARFVTQRYANTFTAVNNPPTNPTLGVSINTDLVSGPAIITWGDQGLNIGFNQNVPRWKSDNTFAYSDTLTATMGRSTWKFGGRFAAVQEASIYAYQTNGEFDFLGSQTGIGSGSDLADFLFGLPDDYSQYPKASNNEHQKQYSGFAQDEWQASPRLTLNFGLRYEYYTPEGDTEGHTFAILPGLTSKRFVNAPPGMVVPGDPGAPNGWYFPDRRDFAPRFGFAWDLSGDGHTSLRGGAGLFFDSLNGWMSDWNNGVLPWWPSATIYYGTSNIPANGPAGILSAPYVAGGTPDPFPSKPPPPSLDFAGNGFFPFGYGSLFVDPHLRTPYVYQYNLSIEHQLGAGLMAEIGYVGSSTHKEVTWADSNPILPSTIAACTLATGSRCGTRLYNSVLNLQQGSSTAPNYAPMTQSFYGLVHANYNGLVASLAQRPHPLGALGNVFYTLSYTWSHSLDNGGEVNSNDLTPFLDRNALYGNSGFDLRQRFVFSGGWTLPFDQLGGWKELTSGWNLFPIVTLQSGTPIDFSLYSNGFVPESDPGPSGYGDRYLVRPDQLAQSVQFFNPRQTQTLVSGVGKTISGNFWYNPGDFAPDACIAAQSCPVGFYGGYRRNSITGPAYMNFDLALQKNLPLGESQNVELRVEAFNILNHTQFKNPGSGRVSSAAFGVISQTYDPRILQLAVRFTF